MVMPTKQDRMAQLCFFLFGREGGKVGETAGKARVGGHHPQRTAKKSIGQKRDESDTIHREERIGVLLRGCLLMLCELACGHDGGDQDHDGEDPPQVFQEIHHNSQGRTRRYKSHFELSGMSNGCFVQSQIERSKFQTMRWEQDAQMEWRANRSPDRVRQVGFEMTKSSKYTQLAIALHVSLDRLGPFNCGFWRNLFGTEYKATLCGHG